MAAIRSALTMLGRRSCSCGSTGAASLAGTGLETHQVFRPAAPRTPPLPSLRPAGHSQSYRHFSAGGRPVEEAENGLCMWWQRCMYRIKNADIEQQTKFVFWCSVTVVGASTFYTMKTMNAIRRIK